MENTGPAGYLAAMARDLLTDAIVPADYPGLRGLVWNRDPAKAIPAAEAFAIYERNWRHLDEATFTVAERRLLAGLKERFGHGVFLS